MKLILVHGLGQTAAVWEQIKHDLQNVIDVECPELFFLECDENVTYKYLYLKFEKFCNQFEEPLILCGLSLGGILCLHYTLKCKHQVNKLILIGTQYKMPKYLLLLQNILFYCLPKKIFQNLKISKKGVIQLCHSMINLDFSKKLTNIMCPTLIICGENDFANVFASKKMHFMIKKSKLMLIPDTGHEINKEEPKKLSNMIQAFILDKVDIHI